MSDASVATHVVSVRRDGAVVVQDVCSRSTGVQDRIANYYRPRVVVNGAALPVPAPSRVAAKGGVRGRHSRARPVVKNATTGSSGVAADRAIDHLQNAQVVDAAASSLNGVATDRAVG